MSLIETREPRRNSTGRALTTRLSHGNNSVGEPTKEGRMWPAVEQAIAAVWVMLAERAVVTESAAKAVSVIAAEPGRG